MLMVGSEKGFSTDTQEEKLKSFTKRDDRNPIAKATDERERERERTEEARRTVARVTSQLAPSVPCKQV
jgi:hypothetical protein